jgi:hypothetical protein
MRPILCMALLVGAGCSSTTTVVVASPSETTSTVTTPPAPTTEVVTYEVDGSTGPGFPYKPVTITYLENDLQKTVHVNAGDLPWSRNVEIHTGDSVYLSVKSSVFTTVSCDVDAVGLLNPLKGKEDVAQGGWTCVVSSHTLTF